MILSGIFLIICLAILAMMFVPNKSGRITSWAYYEYDGKLRQKYSVEQRHFAFRWWWVPYSTNCLGGEYMEDSFDTYEKAKDLYDWMVGNKKIITKVLIER